MNNEAAAKRRTARRESMRIEGMDCPACASKIKSVVGAMPGVDSVNVVFAQGRMQVAYNQAAVTIADIESKIRNLGFETPDSGSSSGTGFSLKSVCAVFALCALAAGLASKFLVGDARTGQIFFIASIAVGGIFTVRNAGISLWNRRIDINVLMMIAVSGAIYINEWTEASAVVSLFALANALEGYSATRARREIASLLSLSPSQAAVLRNGAMKMLPVEDVSIGERVLVKPGERVPLDGLVVSGETEMNESPITGESTLIEKTVGSEVFAGSINDSGTIEFETTRPSTETALARALQQVEEAQARRSPAERYLDKFAAYYTPVVVAIAIIIATVPPLVKADSFDAWFYKSLVFLVAGCPCALALAAPIAMSSSLARASRMGVLFKGGAAMEALAGIRSFAFDKTGTLTLGELRVASVHPEPGYTEEDALRIGASVGALSEHAVGKAVLYEAEDRGIEHAESGVYTSYPGKGGEIVADGSSMILGNARMMRQLGIETKNLPDIKGGVFAVQDGKLIGQIALIDTMRDETPGVVEELRELGISPIVMLTGDRRNVAIDIGGKAGVDEVHYELLPEDKAHHTAGMNAAMVGDGINDAPALASSKIGIAMGGAGFDIAMEAADITLASGNLRPLPSAVRLSRKALFVVQQNVWFAIITKAIVLLLAAFSDFEWMLLLAVVADVGVSMAVVLNGLRMLKMGRKDEAEHEAAAAA